jgi:translation initiation factor 2D
MASHTLQDNGNTTTNNNNSNNNAAAGVSNTEDTSLRDEVMWSAALGALVKLTNKVLPLPIADFYSKYMAPLRPADFAFDFKKSKFKKLSKLLEALEEEKVVSLKQIRKESHIVSVHHDHDLLKNWVPHAMLVAGSKKQQEHNPSIDIELLYKPRSSLRKMVFRCEEKDALFGAQEAQEALNEYCRNNCSTSQSSKVSIDQFLATELFEKNKRPTESDFISMETLQSRFLNNLQPWHQLKRRLADGSTVELLNKGEFKPLVVVGEKRQGRQVTCVIGAERFGYELPLLAETLQKRMKTACFISDLPGKAAKGQELALAGDWLSKDGKFNLLNFFKEEGFPAKCIEVTNKLKK